MFQSQIDLNTRVQEMQSQQLILAQATTDLLNVLNVKPDCVIRIKDSIVVDKNIRINDVLQAVNANPQIGALGSQIKINEFLEKETLAQRYPSLRANTGINYGRNQSNGGQLLLNQSYGPFLGLTLSVPLYNSGIVKRQQQIAKINTTNAKLQKENIELDFKSGAIKTYQAYTSSLQQIATQQNTFQLSQQLVQLSLQRFQLAAATIIEVREAQKSFEEAGFRLINSNYLAKLAEIELKRISNGLAN